MSKTNREKLSDVLWNAGIFDHEYGDKIIELFDEERRIAREEEREMYGNAITSVMVQYHPASIMHSDDKKLGAYEAIEMLADKLALTTPLEDPN